MKNKQKRKKKKEKKYTTLSEQFLNQIEKS